MNRARPGSRSRWGRAPRWTGWPSACAAGARAGPTTRTRCRRRSTSRCGRASPTPRPGNRWPTPTPCGPASDRPRGGQPPTPGRTRLKGEERRQLILEAARRVFLETGFAGARTRRIAEEAGITEALLYRFFPSKLAIYEAAVLQPLEALEDEPL